MTLGDNIGTPKANAIPKPITVMSTLTRKKKDIDKEEIHLTVPNKEKQNSISLMSSKTSGSTLQVEGNNKNSKAHKSSTLDLLSRGSSNKKDHVVEDYKKYKQIRTE